MLSRMRQVIRRKLLQIENDDDAQTYINEIPNSQQIYQNISDPRLIPRKALIVDQENKSGKNKGQNFFSQLLRRPSQVEFSNDADLARIINFLTISKDKRNQREMEVVASAIRKTPFFGYYKNVLEDQDVMIKLCLKLQYTYFNPFEEIMSIGESARKMILLMRGTVIMLVHKIESQEENNSVFQEKEPSKISQLNENNSKEEEKELDPKNFATPEEFILAKYQNLQIVKTFNTPDVFGDIELFHRLKRSSTLITTTIVHLATLEMRDFHEIFMECESIKDRHIVVSIIELFKNSYLFSKLNDAVVHNFIRYSDKVSLYRGQSVFMQGEAADDVFIIDEGEVELKKKNSHVQNNQDANSSSQILIQQVEREQNQQLLKSSSRKRQPGMQNVRYVAVLGPGEVIGEDFIESKVRNYSAVCKSVRLILYKIKVSTFLSYFYQQNGLNLQLLNIKSDWRAQLSETASRIEQSFEINKPGKKQLMEMKEQANEFSFINAFGPETNTKYTFNIPSSISSLNNLSDTFQDENLDRYKQVKKSLSKQRFMMTSSSSKLNLTSDVCFAKAMSPSSKSNIEYQYYDNKISNSPEKLKNEMYFNTSRREAQSPLKPFQKFSTTKCIPQQYDLLNIKQKDLRMQNDGIFFNSQTQRVISFEASKNNLSFSYHKEGNLIENKNIFAIKESKEKKQEVEVHTAASIEFHTEESHEMQAQLFNKGKSSPKGIEMSDFQLNSQPLSPFKNPIKKQIEYGLVDQKHLIKKISYFPDQKRLQSPILSKKQGDENEKQNLKNKVPILNLDTSKNKKLLKLENEEIFTLENHSNDISHFQTERGIQKNEKDILQRFDKVITRRKPLIYKYNDTIEDDINEGKQIIVNNEYYYKEMSRKLKEIESRRTRSQKKALHFNPFNITKTLDNDHPHQNLNKTNQNEIEPVFNIERAKVIKEFNIDQKFPKSPYAIESKIALQEINQIIDKEHIQNLQDSNLGRLRKKLPTLMNDQTSKEDVISANNFILKKKKDQVQDILKGYCGNIDQRLYLKLILKKIEKEDLEYASSNYNFTSLSNKQIQQQQQQQKQRQSHLHNYLKNSSAAPIKRGLDDEHMNIQSDQIINEMRIRKKQCEQNDESENDSQPKLLQIQFN